MKRAAVLLVLAAAACSPSPPPVTGWPFDPIRFFAGHTHGEATLHVITGASHHVSIDSRGKLAPPRGLILDQTIREQDKPARVRRWVLAPAGPNRWTGTLTDADGPVEVVRTDRDVAIRYRMHDGSKVEQHLQQPADGLVRNHLTVSKYGLRVATLDEVVRKDTK